MLYVYILRSHSRPRRRYTGFTYTLERRIEQHNLGLVPSTASFRPWELVAAILFADTQRGISFEKYLKSGSGRAFSKRHFWIEEDDIKRACPP